MSKNNDNTKESIQVVLTDHAFNRLKERSGLNKKAAQNLAERSYNEGIKHGDTTGNLNKYISGITYSSHKGTDIRLYGDKLFIFNKKDLHKNNQVVLITVMQIPHSLIKQAINVKEKKNGKK